MTSIYSKIKERLRPEFANEPMYEEILLVVWDKVIELMTVNGTLVKTKGEAVFPPRMLLEVVRYGIIAFLEPDNTKAKMDFKDAFNLLNFYILDDYNLRDMRKEKSDNDQE